MIYFMFASYQLNVDENENLLFSVLFLFIFNFKVQKLSDLIIKNL